MSDIIAVKNLVEVYSDGTKAVDDISFNVKKGEFFGFLGPNGAGKSTTIKLLTSLLRKTSGSVTVAGHDIDAGAAAIYSLYSYKLTIYFYGKIWRITPVLCNS